MKNKKREQFQHFSFKQTENKQNKTRTMRDTGATNGSTVTARAPAAAAINDDGFSSAIAAPARASFASSHLSCHFSRVCLSLPLFGILLLPFDQLFIGTGTNDAVPSFQIPNLPFSLYCSTCLY